MNGVKIYVGDDINNNDIILNGQAIDLFGDENIQITLKQTDIRDISTNYADFTQNFTIPASPKNNRILKYWYDTFNDNQFPSVSGIPCRIDIDGIFFKKGVLKIQSAQTNDYGVIKNYTVQFTSNLKSLKDKFGDTKIGDLNYEFLHDGNQFEVNDSFVKNKIENSVNASLEYPMISTKRLINSFNDVKYVNSSTLNGLRIEELRPALKFKDIFQSIQDFYGIRFIGDFYTNNSPLDKLYLWLNKNKDQFLDTGKILDLDGVFASGITISNNVTLNSDNNFYTFRKNAGSYKITQKITLYTTNTTTEYKLFIQQVVLNPDSTINEAATDAQDNRGFVASSDFVTGNLNLNYSVNTYNLSNGTKLNYRLVVQSKGQLLLDKVRVSVYETTGFYSSGSSVTIGTTINQLISNVDNTFTSVFNVKNNIPDMTVQDFITSIIKMFNLVIIPETNPLIHNLLGTTEVFRLEYFTKFYGQINEIDITKYVKRSLKINKISTYKNIVFKHEDSSYGLNKIFFESQTPNREYGSVNQDYSSGDNGDFKIETKFNLSIFRELPDYGMTASGLENTWIFGDCLNDDFSSAELNRPTIFYYNRKSDIPTGYKIAYTTVSDVSSPIDNYSIFSNVDDLDILSYNNTLTFSAESFFNAEIRQKSLFNNYYRSLLNGVYSPYSREYEVEAVLPKFIYTNLSLGSRLIVNNNRFGITDITINLLTGVTKLKLNNVIEESDIPEYIDNTLPIVPTSMTYSISGTSSVTISWSGASDDYGIQGYEISFKETTDTTWIELPFQENTNSFGSITISPVFSNDTDVRVRVKDISNNWSLDYNTIVVNV